MSKTAKQAVMLALKSMVAIAFFTLVSAGTFDYWQAWVLLAVCIISLSLVIPFLLIHHPEMMKRRMQSGTTGEPELLQKLIKIIYRLCFALTFVIPGLDRRFAWSEMPLALCLAGYVPFLLGCYLAMTALRENSFAVSTVQVADEQQVTSTGVYSVVRHPMYSGITLVLLSIPLLLGSFWSYLPAVGALTILIIRLLNEEQLLKEELAGYADYTEKVRFHLVPGLW